MPRLRANLVSVYVLREPATAGQAPALLTLQRAPNSRFPGQWQVVHGHIEAEETAWRAAERELGEETGLRSDRWFRLLRLESFYNPENDSIYFVPVFVVVVGADAAVALGDEHAAACWRSLPEARALFTWSTQKETVEALLEATRDWPAPGAGLQPIDLAALRAAWARRAAHAARGAAEP